MTARNKTKLRKLWVWNDDESNFYESKIIGYSLHVCCGKSLVGDVRCDIDPQDEGVQKADYRELPYSDLSFDTVICDPPWFSEDRFAQIHGSPSLKWILELKRIAKKRIIIIHNTLFHIPQFSLTEAWAVNSKGLLWKVCGIYDRNTLPIADW